jgi:restriction endonuclease S subunit
MLDFSSTTFTKTIKTIKARELKTTPGLVNYRLSDKSFELCIGNRVLSDEVESDGLYPIYSANVYEEFGRISKQNLTDFTFPSIVWGIDGDWMVNIIPAGQPFYPTDHCGVLRIKDNPEILPDYFALALEVAGIHEKFSRHNRASTQRIKKLLIQVPPKSDQYALLEKYHEITAKIDKEEKTIFEINQEIKQQYLELFGTIDSSKYGSSPLEKVCQFITDGTHQTPTYTTEGNGIKFLSSKDVTKEYIDWSNIEYIPYDLHEQLSKRIAPIKNDILLAKNGTIGIAALNDTDEIFDVYVSLAVLRPNELVTPEYLLCAINCDYTKKLFKDSIVGIGVPNLHLNVIQKTMIVLPDITEQQEFTSFVKNKLTEKKSAILRKKELENERKKYLINNF